MGAIHFSLDPDLAGLLSSSLGIRTFVETGTFRGDSVEVAKRYFDEIHTCELSDKLYLHARERFIDDPGVHCHLGPSPDLLASIVPGLSGRQILFWLDAHWCEADDTAGVESQCPLLEELEAIAPLHPDSVVWIDDARYFMAPPPKPLKYSGWPTFNQVQERLLKLGRKTHKLIFASDTILFHPNRVEDEVGDYLHRNGADWLALTHEAKTAMELRAQVSRLEAKLAKSSGKRSWGLFKGR